MTRRFVWFGIAIGGVAVVLLLCAAVVVVAWPTSKAEKIRRALDLVRLADLPASATAVEADGTSNAFSMTYMVRFQAPADDIEAFLGHLAGLRKITPEQLTPEHMCLPYAERGGVAGPGDADVDRPHYRYSFDGRYPWFKPTVRGRGRVYKIPQDARARYGEVIVDDETGTVFIKAHRS